MGYITVCTQQSSVLPAGTRNCRDWFLYYYYGITNDGDCAYYGDGDCGSPILIYNKGNYLYCSIDITQRDRRQQIA